ncbi:hypothetical protein Tco_0210995 [Tanacetum coccineum]
MTSCIDEMEILPVSSSNSTAVQYYTVKTVLGRRIHESMEMVTASFELNSDSLPHLMLPNSKKLSISIKIQESFECSE